ncbi:hypothetical protein ES707_08077 [subsurface metagenome]
MRYPIIYFISVYISFTFTSLYILFLIKLFLEIPYYIFYFCLYFFYFHPDTYSISIYISFIIILLYILLCLFRSSLLLLFYSFIYYILILSYIYLILSLRVLTFSVCRDFAAERGVKMAFSTERPVSQYSIDEAIVLIVGGLAKKFGKNYCFPSQEKLRYILRSFYGIRICLRTLNYHLKRLEAGGYIYRKRRIARGRGGVLNFKSTLYFLRDQALRWIAKLRRLSSFLSSRFTPVSPKPKPEPWVSRERAKELLGEIRKKLDDPGPILAGPAS